MAHNYYVLVDKDSGLIKADAETGMLCIFATINEARKVKSEFASGGDVSVIGCDLNYSNKELIQ
jgi:hypothetical protein